MHLFAFWALSCCLAYSTEAAISVYVVPTPVPTSRQEDGTLENPFSTIEQARDYFRATVRHSLDRVALYPTYYFVGRSLIFDQRDNLSIYTAMTPDEQNQIEYSRKRNLVHLDFPVISGGIQLTNWTNDRGIWSIAVSDSLPAVTQLFVDDQRAVRSRLPPTGYFTYDSGLDNRSRLAYQGFVYQENQFANITLSSTATTEFIVYHSFTASRHYFAQNFPLNRTVLFSNPSLSVIGNASIAKQSGRRFHLENVYEGMLIQEGSFFFDGESRVLHYHPRTNQSIESTVVILPILETILSITDANQMEFHSIGIQHSAWIGAASTINKTAPIDGRAAADYLDRSVVSVYLRNSTDILFNRTEIAHLAGYAMQIDRQCKRITVANSHVFDLGAGGIRIGTGTDNEHEDEPTENVAISNCTLFDGGHLFAMGVGVLVQRKTRNISITENTIYRFYHTAIHVGWSWSYEESGSSHHTISSNYIHHVGQSVLSDLAAIYTCGLLNGSLIAGNVVHDIYGYFLNDWGVFLADGTSQLTVVNTIVYNTGAAAFAMIYGFNNTFRNNILARSSDQSDGALSLYRREPPDHLAFTFRHNIVYDTVNLSGRWIFQVQAPDPFSAPFVVMDENCYFNLYGNMMIFGLGRLVFSEWQETGHDMNSLIADPLFPFAQSQCDFFNLSSDSPAIQRIHFKPIAQLPQWHAGCSTKYSISKAMFY